MRTDGLEIAIPGDALSGSGTLSTEVVEDDGLKGWSITFDGDAELAGEAVITFPGDVQGDEPAPVLLYNEHVGEPLNYGGDPVETEDGKYAITTTHFSNWFQLDWGDLLAKGVDLAKRAFGANPDAGVSCQGTDAAVGAGYSVTLDGNPDTYTWCLGMDGDVPVVKVGNPWPYAVRVEVTPGLTLTDPDETLTSLLPRLFSALSDPPKVSGNTAYLLGPGDSYTFRWASMAEQQQGVLARPSAAAYIASALLFSVDTVKLVWRDASATEVLETIADTASCTTGLPEMVQADVGEPLEFSEYFHGAVDTLFACLGKVIEKAYGEEGVLGVALISAVSWLLTGIKLVVYSGVAIANIAPVTAVINGPEVLTPVPVVDATSFCRQVLDRQPVQQATEMVGYSWSEVNWKDTKALWGKATLADDWLECSINAGGMAPLYEVVVWIEFYSASGEAQEQFEKINPSRDDEVVRIELDVADGNGFLNVYDGRPGDLSAARGYAYRDNVFVIYELRVGVPAGPREMGWPDLDTHTKAASEAIDRALSYAGE